jgi:hypothetical protein
MNAYPACIYGHGKTAHIMEMLALCEALSGTRLTLDAFRDLNAERPEREELMQKIISDFEVSSAAAQSKLEQTFFPNETAWERRNRNAPWYRRLNPSGRRSRRRSRSQS